VSLPFTYTPRPGEWIAIGRNASGGVTVTVHKQGSERTVAILAGEAPGFAAAASEAIREAAENEPDPAEVEELTCILRGIAPGMAHPGEDDYKTAVVRPFAEAALRWMRDKQQREEQP